MHPAGRTTKSRPRDRLETGQGAALKLNLLFLLFHQSHPTSLGESGTGTQAIEICSGSNWSVGVVGTIPDCSMGSGGQGFIDQGFHESAVDGVDVDSGLAVSCQRKLDGR